MKKNFRLFIDMDNTLVDFGDTEKNSYILDRMYEKGFFENLPPLPFLKEMNKIAALFPENIYVITACLDTPYCMGEKIIWLKKHLPNAMKENVIFTKLARRKSSYAVEKLYGESRKRLTKYDVLIDDYGKNIVEWQRAGGTAIKFKNNYNGSSIEKYNYVISDFSQLLDMLEVIRTDLDQPKRRVKYEKV